LLPSRDRQGAVYFQKPEFCDRNYLGQGGATYAAAFSVGTGPSPGDVLVENLHGQSTSSGLPDIVAPDASGGVTVLINKTK